MFGLVKGNPEPPLSSVLLIFFCDIRMHAILRSPHCLLPTMELAKSFILALLALHAWLAAGSVVDDRLALMSFMSGMTANSSLAFARSSWGNRSVPTCEWRGMACGLSGRRRGRVVALDLPGLGLGGTVPPELGNLTYLRRLHLPANHLHGVLPLELGSLPDLRHLNLSYNSFQGRIPASLSNCS